MLLPSGTNYPHTYKGSHTMALYELIKFNLLNAAKWAGNRNPDQYDRSPMLKEHCCLCQSSD